MRGTMNKFEVAAWEKISKKGVIIYLLTRGLIPGGIVTFIVYLRFKHADIPKKNLILLTTIVFLICMVAAIEKWYRSEKKYKNSI